MLRAENFFFQGDNRATLRFGVGEPAGVVKHLGKIASGR